MKAKERQRALHRDMTEEEEAYHAAYPNVRAPILGAMMAALLGRNGRGMVLWGLVGVMLAVFLWVGLAYLWR